jgi:hypothetical protein
VCGLQRTARWCFRIDRTRTAGVSCRAAWGNKMPSRLRVASVLAVVAFLALLILPKIDDPETRFDEANSPTNEMLVQRMATTPDDNSSRIASAPRIGARAPEICGRLKPSVRAGQLSDPRRHLEILCALLC